MPDCGPGRRLQGTACPDRSRQDRDPGCLPTIDTNDRVSSWPPNQASFGDTLFRPRGSQVFASYPVMLRELLTRELIAVALRSLPSRAVVEPGFRAFPPNVARYCSRGTAQADPQPFNSLTTALFSPSSVSKSSNCWKAWSMTAHVTVTNSGIVESRASIVRSRMT